MYYYKSETSSSFRITTRRLSVWNLRELRAFIRLAIPAGYVLCCHFWPGIRKIPNGRLQKASGMHPSRSFISISDTSIAYCVQNVWSRYTTNEQRIHEISVRDESFVSKNKVMPCTLWSIPCNIFGVFLILLHAHITNNTSSLHRSRRTHTSSHVPPLHLVVQGKESILHYTNVPVSA